MTKRLQLALAATLLLAGCAGELTSPDLAHGSVRGQVVGAGVDAFAYPLGHPELAASVAADGTVQVDAVPVGPTRLVVYDDTQPGGTRRAELVELEVAGASVVRFVRNGEKAGVADADKMGWAGTVVASVSTEGGGVPVAPRFTVEGTTLGATAAPGSSAAVLGLLPQAVGVFQLVAVADGYQATTRPIDVASASNAFDVPVAIATGTAGPIGCAASGGGCVNGLLCEAASGRCVQCLAGGDCASGACDPVEHFCAASQGGGTADGAVCATCTGDSQCQGGGGMISQGRCEMEPGAPAGYCTWVTFFPENCPAGFLLLPDAAGADRCVPAVSCAAYFTAFGQGCLGDEGCRAGGAIPGAVCLGADPSAGLPGTCTAACTSSPETCVVPGFSCKVPVGGLSPLCLR